MLFGFYDCNMPYLYFKAIKIKRQIQPLESVLCMIGFVFCKFRDSVLQ